MRPLELVLTLANVLASATLLFSPVRAPLPPGLTTPLPLLLVAVQTLVEGKRWQMVPAYLIAGALFVCWLPALRPGSHAQPVTILVGVGSTVLVATLAASIALPLAFPVFRFPVPSGPYAIGSATFHWIDGGRPELFAPEPGHRRALMAQVWYPAQAPPGTRRAPYLEDAPSVTRSLARLLKLPAFFFAHLRYVTTNAARDVPVAATHARFPVLIYLTGYGGFRSANTFQTEELVSRGYIVVGLDQPGGAASVRFPDGRRIDAPPQARLQPLIDQSLEPAEDAPSLDGKRLVDGILPYFARDVSLALDRLSALDREGHDTPLAGRLDLERIGVLGISLGAMVGAEAAHRDRRVGAALMMDAAMPADVVRDGLRQPSMWMTRPADSMRLERRHSGGWTEHDIDRTVSSMRHLFERSTARNAYYLQIPGMFHVNFTDAAYYSPIGRQLGLTGAVDARRMYRLINDYTVAFFNTYLKDRHEPLLDGPTGQQQYVIFERR